MGANNSQVYLHTDVVRHILSFVEPKKLLRMRVVCKEWNEIIKSTSFWMIIYERKHGTKGKLLPWYLYYQYFTGNYFDTNLLLNGNGEKKYQHWQVEREYGDKFRIEDPPCGSDELPSDPDFNGHSGCYATSYYECTKSQYINIDKSSLQRFIIDQYNPTIYVSEWTAARFDCGSIYRLKVFLIGYDSEGKEVIIDQKQTVNRVEQWEGSKWKKMEIVFEKCPKGVRKIKFWHEGQDTQFWKGHYGSKMAGGVVKIKFDSLDPTVPETNILSQLTS